MARRSPMNPRYQKDAPLGKTRRSSSAVKLKRDAGSTKGGSAPKKGGSPRQRLFTPLPTNPEIKRWRRIWWGLLGVAVLAALTFFIPAFQEDQRLQSVALGVETAALIAALYVDFSIIRRLRREAIEEQKKGSGKGKSGRGKGE